MVFSARTVTHAVSMKCSGRLWLILLELRIVCIPERYQSDRQSGAKDSFLLQSLFHSPIVHK